MKFRLREVLTAAQVAGDVMSVVLAYALSAVLWTLFKDRLPEGFQEHIPLANYGINALVTLVILLPVFRSAGLYRDHHSLLNIREYQELLRGWLLTAILTLAGVTLIERSFQSRGIFATVWILLLFCLFFFRFSTYRLGIYLRRRGWNDRRVLIYGAGEVGAKLLERIRRSPKVGMDVRGFLDDDAQRHGENIQGVVILGGFGDLAKIVKEQKVDEVLVAMTRAPKQVVRNVLDACHKVNVPVRLVPSLFDIVLPQVDFSELDGVPLLGMSAPQIPPGSAVVKQLFDWIVSIGLLLLFAPVMVVLAMLIIMTDGRPVLFSQKRVGQGGRLFSIYKFRSMYTHAPKYGVTPESGHDPRITPIGRFLRRTSLDELPQLFNVLRGEMSLVGPRPEMPFIVETYNELQRQRLNAKPGITGLWQISPDRATAIHENMDYDIYYIRHQSFLLDVAILLKTGISVIDGEGAW